MKGNLKRLSCLWLGIFLSVFLAFPVFAEEEALESPSEPPLSVSVCLEDGAAQQYLIPPLTLQCPHGTTVAGLLDLLKKYAYLTGYHLENNSLLEIEMMENGASFLYGSSGEWLLLVNGVEISAGSFPVLADGDQICWRYYSEYTETFSEPSRRVASASVSTIWNGDYNARLTQAASWLKSNQALPATLTSLGAAGISVDYRKIAALKEQIHSQENSYPSAALAASDALAVSFCGIPAGNVGGENLLAAVYDYPDISKGGSLSPAFALLALDCNSYPLPAGSINTRATLCTVLCSYQNEDGGFARVKGAESDSGCTAFAVTALSAYPENSVLRDAVSQGLQYLSAVQLEDGSFPSGGEISSALATEAVVIALCATATPLDSPDFLRQASVLDALTAFQTESGGFASEIGFPADEVSTAGGVLALAAAKNFRNIFLLQTPISGKPAQTSSTLSEPESSLSTFVEEGQKEAPAAAEPKKAILFGSLGLTAGVLLGGVALLAVILFYRRKFRKHTQSEELSVKGTEE